MSQGINIHGMKQTWDQLSQNWAGHNRGGHMKWTNSWCNFFSRPIDCFWVERKVGLLRGKSVTRTKRLWGPVSIRQNVRSELSLGPNVCGGKIKARIVAVSPSPAPPTNSEPTVGPAY
jgi:hypothetical protein